MIFSLKTALLLLASISSCTAVKYSEYIYAPKSRTIYPETIYRSNGSVTNAQNLVGAPSGGTTTFNNAASVTFDFGKNIEGIVSVNIKSIAASQHVGVTFTESSLWISTFGCDATADAGLDEPLWFAGTGVQRADDQHRRGAFRYMTVQTNGTGAVQLSSVSIYYTAYPDAADNELGNYPGYFHSSDEKLNHVWYAGAYTNQICVIDADSGNSLVHLGTILSANNDTFTTTWYNNYTITNGTSAFVDGAKRDRTVWPGDYTVAIPSTFVATNDLQSIRNGLDSLWLLQNASGAMPYAGVPFYPIVQSILGPSFWSFTYHCHGLTDLYLYYMYTGDMAYLAAHWARATLGLSFAMSLIDSTGLALLPAGNPDWLRNYMGGYNIEANSILYRLIYQMIELAEVLDHTDSIASWTTTAANIKSGANKMLWNNATGLYNDNQTTTFNPQDGNVFAIISGIADFDNRDEIVSNSLMARWTKYGPPAPEAGATISPFITSFELQAHMAVGKPQRSIDLIRFMWFDWMMNNPQMTNSTFIEGYNVDGSLNYPAYLNNPRISHAHGWATGPTSALSQLVAGIQFITAAGKTWLFAPQVGDLTFVTAGFPSSLGMFEANYTAIGSTGFSYQFSAPASTNGNVTVPVPAACTKAGTAMLSQQSQQSSGSKNGGGGHQGWRRWGSAGWGHGGGGGVFNWWSHGGGNSWSHGGGAGVSGQKMTIPQGTTAVSFTGVAGGDWSLTFTCAA